MPKTDSQPTTQIVIGAATGAGIALLGILALFAWRSAATAASRKVASETAEPTSATEPTPAPKPEAASSQDASAEGSSNGPAERIGGNGSADTDAAAATAPRPQPGTRPNLQPGLLKVHFGRLSRQKGKTLNVHLWDLGTAVGNATPLTDIRNWKYQPGQNAVAFGLLKIDEPGEYVFKTYNYYDRNKLILGETVVCKYRGSVRGGSDSGGVNKSKERIHLAAGYIPIAAHGTVDARGSMEVRWCPPGKTDFESIPSDRLWHDPSWPYQEASQLWDTMLKETP